MNMNMKRLHGKTEYFKKENSTAISVEKLTIIRSADLLQWEPLWYRNKLDDK